MHRLVAIPAFALWLFTWCIFFGCTRQVAVTQSDTQSDTVETHIVRLSEVSGTVPDSIGAVLSIPHLDISVVRVSDSVLLVRTPVRTDTRTFVRHVSTKQVYKNAFNQDSYNDTKQKKSIVDSPESGNKLKRSQHRATDSGNSRKQVEKSNFPWWWWLIVAAVLVALGIGYWVYKTQPWTKFM